VFDQRGVSLSSDLPAQLKNEPAQNVEMKDFCLAVGKMPLILRRAFGTARWRHVISLQRFRTTRKMTETSSVNDRHVAFESC
jgi:hypothetical protein